MLSTTTPATVAAGDDFLGCPVLQDPQALAIFVGQAVLPAAAFQAASRYARKITGNLMHKSYRPQQPVMTDHHVSPHTLRTALLIDRQPKNPQRRFRQFDPHQPPAIE